MPRLARSRILTWAAVVFVILLALSVVAYLRFDPDTAQAVLLSQLERRLGREVRVDAVDVSLWPRFRLILQGLTVASKPPDPKRPLLTMKDAKVYVRVFPLLVGRLVIRQIELVDPVMILVRNRPGQESLGDWLGEAEAEQGAGMSGAGRVFVTRTKVVGGTFILVDRVTPVSLRLENLNLEASNMAYGRRPRFRIEATMARPSPGGHLDLEGTTGKLSPGLKLADLPLDVALRTRGLDLGPLRQLLPEAWRKKIRAGVLTADLRLSGRAGRDLEVKGDVRFEHADLGERSPRLRGALLATLDSRREDGITKGSAKLHLAPGAFSQGSLTLDGDAEADATFRVESGEFVADLRIDATKAAYTQGGVLKKQPGTRLVLEGKLQYAGGQLRVSDAKGRLGDLPFTGHARIGRRPAPGRSRPLDLHFAPEAVDLATLDSFVEGAAPFELGGTAKVTRLDILRRPGEERRWQVTLEMDLSGASAITPPQGGRAHTVEDLQAHVRITPGLLRVDDARARVNGVPVAFQGEIEEFMSLFSGDPGLRRADVRVEISEKSIDLDRLLPPAWGGPAPGEARAAESPGEAQAAESPGEAQAAESPGEAGTTQRDFLDRFLVSRGTLRAEKAVYAKQPLSDLTVSFTYHHPVLRLQETLFRSSEGDWQVGGTVALDGGPTFDLDVRAAHVRVEDLVESFSKSGKPSRIFGILDGEAALHGRGKEVADWEKTLHGSGQVRIRDGRLPSFNIFESVIRAFLGLFSRILPIKNIGSLSEPSTFQRFDQSFEIRGGRVQTDNLVLITDDYHLSGRGSCGIDGTLDYQTLVALTPQGTQKMLAVASIPVLNRSFENLKPIPVRVTGTVEKPTILPDASVIPMSVLRGLLRPGPVGEMVDSGAQAVREGVDRLLGRPSRHEPPAKEGPAQEKEGPAQEEAPPRQTKPKEGDLIQRGLEDLRDLLGQ
jgi:hypothetical protein